MARILLFLVGGIAGAALFHVYYRAQEPAARCGWDHPLDRQAREACQAAAATPIPYTAKARHELDDLVGAVAH